jgi:hypothetical protein
MLERLGIFLINIFCKRLTVLVLHWSLVLIIVNRPADISNAGSFPTAQQTPSSHLQFSCPFLNYHHFQKKSQPNAPPPGCRRRCRLYNQHPPIHRWCDSRAYPRLLHHMYLLPPQKKGTKGQISWRAEAFHI